MAPEGMIKLFLYIVVPCFLTSFRLSFETWLGCFCIHGFLRTSQVDEELGRRVPAYPQHTALAHHGRQQV